MTRERIPVYYEDTGCSVAPRCTACPLPRCRYEVPPRVQLGQARATAIKELRRTKGLQLTAIAAELGLSLRTVNRAFAGSSGAVGVTTLPESG